VRIMYVAAMVFLAGHVMLILRLHLETRWGTTAIAELDVCSSTEGQHQCY
jgi:hypothetical protein